MKVILVSHYSGSYGANRSMVDLAKRLQAKGVQVLVVLPRHGGIVSHLREEGLQFEIIFHRIWVTESRGNRLRFLAKRLVSWAANWWADVRLWRLARAWGADLVHINSSCTPVGFRTSRWLGIPLVWHIREYLEEDYGLEFFNPDLAFQEFRNADRVIAVSKDLAKKYQSMVGGTLGVVYNGVEFPALHVQKILKGQRLELLLIGALTPGKGHAEAIKALFLMLRNRDHDVRLRIVGDGISRYRQRLIDLVSEFGLQDRVEFLGYVKDTSALRAESDVALICSAREAFGRVTVEAMASGLLVVAARSGGTCEIVRHGRTGLLYESGNAFELAELLSWVVKNKRIARAFARQGRRHCIKYFGMNRVADEVLSVYSDVCRKNSNTLLL